MIPPMFPIAVFLKGYGIANAALPATNAYMSFMPTADAAKQKQFTLHIPLGLIKPGAQTVFAAGDGTGTNFVHVTINASDQLDFVFTSSSVVVGRRTTTRKLRDYSAFNLITLTMDTPNATALDRMRVYYDLTRETDFAVTTNPAQNSTSSVFTTGTHYFLKSDYAASYADVYLGGNTCLIGQVLEPSNFLDLDLGTGNVKAKDLTPLSPEYLFMFENAGAMGTNSGSAGDATLSGTLSQVTSTPTNVFWMFNALHENRSGTLTGGNLTVSGTVHQVGTLLMDGSVPFTWKVTDAGSGGAYGIELVSSAKTETTYTAAASDVLEFEFDGSNLDVRVNGGSATSVATGLSGSFVPLCKAPCSITTDFTPTDSAFKTLCTNNMSRVPGVGNMFQSVAVTEDNIDAGLATARSGWTDFVDIKKNRSAAETWAWQFSHDSSNEHAVAAADTYQAKRTNAGSNNWVGHSIRIGAAYGTAAGAQAHTNGAGDTTVTHSLGADTFIILFPRANGDVYVHHPYFTVGKLAKLNTMAAPTVLTRIKNITANSFDIESAAPTDTYDYLALSESDFIKLFSSVGNGNADGTFNNIGVSPTLYMQKEDAATFGWTLFDAARTPNNPGNANDLALHSSAAEPVNGIGNTIDLYSVGSKHRSSRASLNASGMPYFGFAIGQPNGSVENTAR